MFRCKDCNSNIGDRNFTLPRRYRGLTSWESTESQCSFFRLDGLGPLRVYSKCRTVFTETELNLRSIQFKESNVCLWVRPFLDYGKPTFVWNYSQIDVDVPFENV